MAADEQLFAKVLFKCLHLTTDSAGRDVKFFSRSRKVSESSRTFESAKCVERWNAQ
ncbi:hypothetical protein V473_08825 [Sphingobium cupriresistens LL01]|uniref:Uncharacterized protein n=1 Tax=Sphingobium cupriresistens LL01 TaxID=1420583 RepID=A0A0J8AXA3_9SPHN|nr:hypothetical protein V473_08825 [Sphingobium cupriresistens LL01]